MLDLGTARQGRPAGAFGAVGVDHRAQSVLGRLSACGVELFLGQGRGAPDPDAGRGEDLDHVGPRRGHLVHVRPDLGGAARTLRHRPDRGQHARTGQRTARDGVAERDVLRTAHALHGGNAALQHGPGVLGRVQHLFLRSVGRGTAVQPAGLAIEVPAQMHVRVDQPGEKCGARQVVDGGGFGGPGGGHGLDPTAADDHFAVGKRRPAPVQHPVGAEHDGRCGCHAASQGVPGDGSGPRLTAAGKTQPGHDPPA